LLSNVFAQPSYTLERKGNNATSANMKLVHWPLMSGLLHLVEARLGPSSLSLTVHPSAASVSNHRIAV